MTILQTFTFDPSGETDLSLKNQFGALQLEACSDGELTNLICVQELTYTYVIQNIGSNNMEIIVVDITRNDETESLLDQVPDTNLSPGEQTVVTETQDVDLCVPGSYTTGENAL